MNLERQNDGLHVRLDRDTRLNDVVHCTTEPDQQIVIYKYSVITQYNDYIIYTEQT
jgi:hypothetical protein